MRKVCLRMNELEKYTIIKDLVDHGGNKNRAAVNLGLSMRQIQRLIKKYKEKGKSRFVHGKKSEAKVREFELKKLLKNGSVFQKKFYTFKDLAQEYYNYKIDTVEKKTFINYAYRLKHAMEKLGHVKLQELNMKILENFYQYLRHTYVSPKTKNILVLLQLKVIRICWPFKCSNY